MKARHIEHLPYLLSALLQVGLALVVCHAWGESATTARERAAMVEQQIAARGIESNSVLTAMRTVPRHEFVPADYRDRAYEDGPLQIGYGQTISQPYIVAAMTELVQPTSAMRVLEIGTGSGYQAAVLSALVAEVHSIEIVEALADSAAARLARLGYANVTVTHADGYHGRSMRSSSLPQRNSFRRRCSNNLNRAGAW
jgi:protein-L-isoaspartate(D-aspartate) O-methyltransferase